MLSSNIIIQHVADRIGVGKLLFGSDTPFSDEGIELMKIKKSGLSQRDKNRVLFKNAERLLKI